MAMKDNAIPLRAAGCGLRGAGYPNAANTLQILKGQPYCSIENSACWLPEDFHLWKLARSSPPERIGGLLTLAAGNAKALRRLLVDYRRNEQLYLPYPSLPLLWVLSWLPARWRPRCIVDAYITLWDTLYQDRQLGTPQGLASRLLLRAERRSLRAAHRIIVDTRANAEHLSQLFDVPRHRIHALPLAIDPATLPPPGEGAPATDRPAPVRVLFIGTFVPLQGTEVIAQAIALLGERSDIAFVLIGDGQQADTVAPLLLQQANVQWQRGWQPPEVLAQELACADICLGVFGGGGKAARVLPFKLYLAMAAGKAIITQQQHSLPDHCPAPPLLTCAPGPEALAQAISALAADRQRRDALGQQARSYYQQHLSAQALQQRWQQLLQ